MTKTAHRGRRFDASALRRILPILSVSAYRHLILGFVAVFVVVSLIIVPRHLFPSNLPATDESVVDRNSILKVAPCASAANGTICCDRTDVCFMNGNVQTHSPSSSILLVSPNTTRDYATGVGGLHLRTTNRTAPCEVRHDVPAIVFSTGGFSGNAYREFKDGLIPLYITSQRFNRRVVFVAVEYDARWFVRYRDVVSRLSDFLPVDFTNDKRMHCFPRAIIGLEIHGGLTINPALTAGRKTIRDFRNVLDEAYKPQRMSSRETSTRPKLVLISRQASRKIENERDVIELAIDVGFKVQVLRPHPKLEPVKTYRALSMCDVMVGVYGAEMTHFLFMRAGGVLVQVVPLGIVDQVADTYYGAPAKESGLTYVSYRITPRESSLYREYRKEDPVLTDAENVSAKGWETTKKVYLNGQNVNLNLTRFREILVRAYEHVVKAKQIRALKERMDLGG